MTGTVVKIQDRTQTTRSGQERVTTRIQKIWLQLAHGKEEYLEFNDFAIDQLRSGHTVTVIYANVDDKMFLVTTWIAQTEKYFYHSGNIYFLAKYSYDLQLNSWKLKGVEGYVLFVLKSLLTFAWKIFCGFLEYTIVLTVISIVFKAYIATHSLVIILGYTAIFCLSKLWRYSRRYRRYAKKLDALNKRLLNHVDRIFGHDLIEY